MMRNLRAFSITSVCLLLAGCMGMASDGTGSTSEETRGGHVDASVPQPDGGGHTGWNGDGGASRYRDAEVDLDPVGQGHVNGEVLFLGRNGLATTTLLAGGFAPASSYTVEIHQNGTCHGDAMNIGPLWSAGGALASLGSVTVDAEGVGTVVRSAGWTLGGASATDPIGHALVVLDGQQKPVACGVIWR